MLNDILFQVDDKYKQKHTASLSGSVFVGMWTFFGVYLY